MGFIYLPNDPCKENHWLPLFRSALLKIWDWEPWENLDLAREPPFEKVREPLLYVKYYLQANKVVYKSQSHIQLISILVHFIVYTLIGEKYVFAVIRSYFSFVSRFWANFDTFQLILACYRPTLAYEIAWQS